MGDFRYMGKSLSGVQRGLGSLTDANISNPQDGDTLVYNGTTGKWEPKPTDEYVEITTVSGDTNASGLTKLFNVVDFSKLTFKSVVYIAGTIFRIDGGTIDGANTSLNLSSVPIFNSTSVVIDRVLLRASSPSYYRTTIKASPAFAFNDYSSQNIGAGVSMRLYY